MIFFQVLGGFEIRGNGNRSSGCPIYLPHAPSPITTPSQPVHIDIGVFGVYFLSVEKDIVLDIEGAIKLGESAEFFSSALDNVLRKEENNVVIDFSGINYIDSTGMGELIGYLSKFSGENRQILLVNPSGRILRLLKAVRLDKVFKIFEDEDAAVAYAEEKIEP